MKINFLIILGISVALSGCMGIVSEKEPHPQPQGMSSDGNKAITNFEFEDKHNKNQLAGKRHVTRMMAWINISTDQP
jgi:uncharacterized protein YceK